MSIDAVADGLFVGTLAAAGNESLLHEHGITAIVSLTYCEPESGFPSEIPVADRPMKDGPQNEQTSFERAVAETLRRLEAGDTVLVHCSAGASRSPSVAATSLALQRELGFEEAFEQVVRRRTDADPHDALVRQSMRVYKNLVRCQR